MATFINLPAGHMIHQFPAVKVFNGSVSHIFSVADNGYLFGNFQNLLQFVADKQCGDAVFLKLLDHAEQGIHFFMRQCSGWLIHDDQFGIVQNGS